jgi:hypothetical protein
MTRPYEVFGNHKQVSEEHPVAGTEPRPGLAQLPFQHRDLVPQRQDLDLLVPVAHREQAQ